MATNIRDSLSAIYINQQDQQCSRKNGQRIWTLFREMKCQWLNIWKDASVFFSKCNFEILILCIFSCGKMYIKLTIFKCIVKWHEVIYTVVQPSPHSPPELFSSFSCLYPWSKSPFLRLPPSPKSLATTALLSAST